MSGQPKRPAFASLPGKLKLSGKYVPPPEVQPEAAPEPPKGE